MQWFTRTADRDIHITSAFSFQVAFWSAASDLHATFSFYISLSDLSFTAYILKVTKQKSVAKNASLLCMKSVNHAVACMK